MPYICDGAKDAAEFTAILEVRLLSGPRQGGRNNRQAQQLLKTCTGDHCSVSQVQMGGDNLRKDPPEIVSTDTWRPRFELSEEIASLG